MIDTLTDMPLKPLRLRRVRLYDLYRLGFDLAELVLIVREWPDTGEADEPPIESIYVVQELPQADHGQPGSVYVLARVNEPATVVSEYDDGEDWHDRLYSCYIPADRREPGNCDCKGYRTFKRCRHLDVFADATRPRAAQASEPEETTDDDLAAWILSN